MQQVLVNLTGWKTCLGYQPLAFLACRREQSPHLQITGQTLHHHFLGEGVDIDSYTVRIQPIQGRIEVVG